MKKIGYFLGCIFLITMSGCEKSLMSYEGEEGVYFAVRWGTYRDTTEWAYQFYTPAEFIKTPEDEMTLKLRVMITGSVKDYDRIFGIAVEADSTTAVPGVNYDSIPMEGIIKKGELFTDVSVTVRRNENVQKEYKTLALKLISTKDFTLSIPVWRHLSGTDYSEERSVFDARRHQIRISDFLSRPPRWAGGVYANGLEYGLWGDYTEKKFRLICSELDLVYSEFENADIMPLPRQRVIAQYMAKFLQDHYDRNDPILEEDGRLMWVTGVSWDSYVGKPWKPVGE